MNDSSASKLKSRDRRRMVLGGGASILSLMIGTPSTASVPELLTDLTVDSATTAFSGLYAFPGQSSGTSVIAVTWQEPYAHAAGRAVSEVTVHTGFHDWTAQLGGDGTSRVQGKVDAQRIFLGEVALSDQTPGNRAMAFVIETPSRDLASPPLQIWAEKKAADGTRERVGSPFLTKFLQEDLSFSALYHSLSPSDDRELLRGPLEKLVFLKAQAYTDVRSAAAFARRISSEMLPDVLHFDQAEPCGFTFAAQNGRYPADRSSAVVDAVFTRAAVDASVDAKNFRRSFPYFSQSSRIV